MRVGLLSLEAWDPVWRRNQHLAARLVRGGAIEGLLFVEPPHRGFAPRAVHQQPEAGIDVVTPPLVVPRRYGGHAVLGRWFRRVLRDVDVLWINDPVAGVGALRPGLPALYDVTDDWRSMPQPESDRARIVAAEDRLAARTRTVVCSNTLAVRWRDRYGVEAALIPNGVDLRAVRTALPIGLEGPGPHAVYVGTIHANRVDVALVASLAGTWPGTVHLAGPDFLPPVDRARLEASGVRFAGALPSAAVPSWTTSADVLICPHLVSDFTLSLDAIKAYEYLATGRPVVATPSSGFQGLAAPGLHVVDATQFVSTALAIAADPPPPPGVPPAQLSRPVAVDWDERAASFADELRSVLAA